MCKKLGTFSEASAGIAYCVDKCGRRVDKELEKVKRRKRVHPNSYVTYTCMYCTS